jgi:hypothetical protein
MSDKQVKTSSKESAAKVEARDDNKSRSEKPLHQPSKQQAAKGQPGAFGKQTHEAGEMSDPPLRKGLHESVPRD